MSLTYAIADLHGRYDLLCSALARIAEHAPADEVGTIVTMGDYIDRGPSSRQIIERLMMGVSDGWKLVCLKGNHEDMMVQTLCTPLNPNWWCGNGGYETLRSYGHDPSFIECHPSKVVPFEHLKWIDSLPFMHVDQHRVFVHAWVDSSIPLDRQRPQKMMWEMYRSGASYGHRLTGRHVVHGHHQFADGPKCYKGRTNLDTFAWSTGRLVVGVFDDDIPGGPVELLEVIGPPYEREM